MKFQTSTVAFIGRLLSMVVLLVSAGAILGSCGDNILVEPSVPDYRSLFRGHWTARAGDIHIRTGLGFVKYNWYVVNPHSSLDSVKVTWDDGAGCTTSGGIITADSLSLQVYFIRAMFRILPDTTIRAAFYLSDTTYFKTLFKDSADTTFYCI